MWQNAGKIALAAALCGLMLVPSDSWGQDRRVRHVQDDAHLFSKDAISQANAVIDRIHAKHKKDFFIETVAEGPEKAMLTQWARARFDNAKVDGVYLVITKKPNAFRIVVGNRTQEKGYFTSKNVDELDKILKQKGKADALLERAVNYVFETMNAQAPRAKANAPAPIVQKAQAPVAHNNPGPMIQHKIDPIWASVAGFICIGLVVLLVVWVVIGIIRMIVGGFSGGGGGYGGGGPGYGYGGGGGGGGFLTSMLGGMFGGMAGMWMYNNFFGGHASYGSNGGVNWDGGNSGSTGVGATAADTYEGDTGVGTSGGGEFGGGDDDAGAGKNDAGDGGGAFGGGDDDAGGGDAGGGDAGGGGGWFGGGGDAGGGGDWGGGGGGDAGGGGDWGGGGGGDFGGGGGGGGDW